MGLGRRAERSRWIMSIGAPRVTGNEDMWRIHGNLCSLNQSPLPMVKSPVRVGSIALAGACGHGAIV